MEVPADTETEGLFTLMTSTGFLLFIPAVLITLKAIECAIRTPYIRDIPDKYVLVTGCDHGFGYDLALRLDKLGCHVVATCLINNNIESLQETLSGRAVVVQMDVTDSTSVQKAYTMVKSVIPDKNGLWGLVNNAGVANAMGPSEWLDKEDYQKVMEVNVFGMHDVTKTFLPLVKKAKGRIINMGSWLGRFSPPFSSAYAMSKHAVLALSDSLRREMKHFGVQVITLEPGGHQTNLTNERRVGRVTMEMWRKTSDETKEEYGDGYPQTLLWICFNTLSFLNSADNNAVLSALEHALLARVPKTRYRVGWDSYIFSLLTLLPDWLMDIPFTWLLPKPNSCRDGVFTIGDLIRRQKILPKLQQLRLTEVTK